MSDNKLIIALDDMSVDDAIKTVEKISDECSEYMDRIVFKIHNIILDDDFQKLVDVFVDKKAKVFLDGKYHDIGNTVTGYLDKLSNSKMKNSVEYLTIHASNGVDVIERVMKEKKELGLQTKILAVTALTSLDDGETGKAYQEDAKHTALRLAKIAIEGGIDGIVCSAHEAGMLRAVYGEEHEFEIITPGIQFKGQESNDQARVMAPCEAIQNGADHEVMGRGILENGEVRENIVKYFNETDGVKSNIDHSKYTFEKYMYNLDWNQLDSVIGKTIIGVKKILDKFCENP